MKRILWLSASIAIGVGIWLTYFVGMMNSQNQTGQAPLDNTHLAIALGTGAFLILVLLKCGVCIAKKMSAKTKQLKTMEQYYKSLFDQNPDLILTFDLEGRFLRANTVIEIYGYRAEELLFTSFIPFVHPDQLDNTMSHFLAAANGTTTNYDTTVFRKDGQLAELNVANVPIIVDNEIVGVYGILKDITKRKQTELDLMEAESKYRSLIENSLVGVYNIQDMRIVYANPRLAEMFGYEQTELIGLEPSVLVHPEDWPMVSEKMREQQEDEALGLQYQYRGVKKDQSIIYVEVFASRTVYGSKDGTICTIIDITERKKSEERVSYLAHHDTLTDLPNRYLFHKNLCMEIEEASCRKQEFAILYIDLDRFKAINGTVGYDTGDTLIKKATERIKNCLRPEDLLSRQGGDEFIVWLKNSGKKDAAEVAQQILNELVAPLTLDQYEAYITASIGICLYPFDGDSAQTLIRNADSAMIYAKRKGKNNFQFYTPDLKQILQDELQLETDLHKALERGEFVVLYQPQVDLLTGKIMGAEALIRWQHPERGIISPATFIPLAEETSLIMQIGEWVLHTACLQNKAWQDMGLAPMVVSVNLSPRQFLQSDIVNTVRRVLEETGLQPQYLELEITESMTMDVNRTISILQELKGLGVKISLDDFGSGYSSLSYLKKFPIDKLKIDQSFVRDSTTDLNVATIVKTIIEMAHSLNLHVIAEGVETKEHLSFLQYNLCDEVQGYLFSKPLPAKEFEKQFTEIEKIARMKGISQGASHNIRIEEELRIIRQDLQDTVRQQQGMIFKFTRQDGRFIHTLCDGELLYRMGLVPGQVVGKALTDFLPPDVAAVKTKYYETAWQGKENVSYEGSINGIVYIATLRPVIRGGFVTEVIGSCIDITERKQVEEALRKSEEKYRLIAENMNDLIGVLDINGVVLYASPSHQTVLGLSPSMLEGRMAFERVHPDDVQDIKKQFARMVSSKMPCQVEFRYIHCDGHEVYVEANGSPVIDEFGELTHIVVVSRDISEQKRTEEFLRKTEGLSTVGELAAGVAHEIRNPLTTIKGFVQLQQQGAFKPTYLDIMLNEVNRIETIINEFLILGNSQEVHIEKIDIGGLLQQVKELLAAQAILKNIQIHCDSKPKLPFIRGNESKLKQMFVNLLKNAIDSMNDGGDIRIEAGKQDYDSILIRIIDQGCGMDEERIKRLGEPCYSTKEKGTGVGLMVSYKIIKEHHGTIDFQSEINRGTTVTVKLPISGTDI